MTPSLALLYSAATDGREVVIDEACLLVGVHSNANTARATVSRDPKTTATSILAPSANTVDENIISTVAGFGVNLSFPLNGGDRLFVSCSGAGCVVLSFQLLPAV
jgi:hypothetical protein